jgi:hypothetical protein
MPEHDYALAFGHDFLRMLTRQCIGESLDAGITEDGNRSAFNELSHSTIQVHHIHVLPLLPTRIKRS